MLGKKELGVNERDKGIQKHNDYMKHIKRLMEDGNNEQPQHTGQKTSYRNGIPQEASKIMVIKFLKHTR